MYFCLYMAKTSIVSIRVPEEEAAKWKKVFYKQVVMENPEQSIIYQMLEKNPDVPLQELEKWLREITQKNIRVEALRNYANRWQLPFTE